ncbi:PREDICTED: agamous-like MADS-box protein AGL80 [Lupinus angustifolius]|nr:PREDICTED: agamous-like MADS-box protein AGL80 [Lupinus angustifolius]
MAYINDINARKASFNKRKKSIFKKVSELTILCGIQACAIIQNPFDFQIEVWPNPERVDQVIERYQNTSLINESRNMNQESFFIQRISKAQQKLHNLRKDNYEKKITLAMFEYIQTRKLPENLTIEDLKVMDDIREKYMKEIENKKAILY